MANPAYIDRFDAPNYWKYAKPQRSVAFQVLAENNQLLRSLQYPAKALDVGCGTGNVTQWLTNYTNIKQIVGVDVSAEMLDFAKSSVDEPRIEFCQADIGSFDTLPAGCAQSFDLATTFAVLHWIPDIRKAFSNIFTCLKSGGYFIGHTHTKRVAGNQAVRQMLLDNPKWSDLVDKNALEIRLAPEQPWHKEEPNESVKQFKMLLEEAGFQVDRCQLYETTHYMSKAEAKDWISTFAFKYIPREKLGDKVDEYLTDISKSHSQHFKTDGDTIIRERKSIFFTARKL